jgi:hypothetical protein
MFVVRRLAEQFLAEKQKLRKAAAMSNAAFPRVETARRRSDASHAVKRAEKIVSASMAAQPFEKSSFGRENPRKAKTIQRCERGSAAPKGLPAKKNQAQTPRPADDRQQSLSA